MAGTEDLGGDGDFDRQAGAPTSSAGFSGWWVVGSYAGVQVVRESFELSDSGADQGTIAYELALTGWSAVVLGALVLAAWRAFHNRWARRKSADAAAGESSAPRLALRNAKFPAVTALVMFLTGLVLVTVFAAVDGLRTADAVGPICSDLWDLAVMDLQNADASSEAAAILLRVHRTTDDEQLRESVGVLAGELYVSENIGDDARSPEVGRRSDVAVHADRLDRWYAANCG